MDSVENRLGMLVPEAEELLRRRYRILKILEGQQTAGRRVLSRMLHVSERTLRCDIQRLSEAGAVRVGHEGIRLTETGSVVLAEAALHFPVMASCAGLEEKLQKLFPEACISVMMDPVRFEARPEGVIRSWQAAAGPDAMTLYRLKVRDASCAAGAWILSADGKPLKRIRQDQDRYSFVQGPDTTAAMVYAVLTYYKDCTVALSEPLARELLQIYGE